MPACPSFALRLLWLAAALSALCGLTPCRAVDVPGAVHVVAGIATTQDGRPLPHATLYLFDLPGGYYGGVTIGSQATVTTDAAGRFVWNVPDDMYVTANTGTRAGDCFALPMNPQDWHMALRSTRYAGNSFQRRQLLESAARRCEMRWLSSGPLPTVSVVVPDVEQVTLLLRGPDGRPLPQRIAQVFAPGTFTSSDGAVVYVGASDAEGRLHLRWFAGLLRLQVLVPGIGFGATGTAALLPGHPVALALPPLAPFARLAGQVVPAAAGPDALVTLESDTDAEHRWYRLSAHVDARGQWAFADALPGTHQIVLSGVPGSTAQAEVKVGAGESVSGIRLALAPAPRTEAAAPSAKPSVPLNPSLPPTAASLSGTVTSTAGRAVAGALIYAVCSYDGGMRIYQQVLTTTTNAQGKYIVPMLPGLQGRGAFSTRGGTVLLLTAPPGYALAEARASYSSHTHVQADLVLPPPTTGLAVRVLQGGKPAAGVPVRLTTPYSQEFSMVRLQSTDNGAARDAAKALLSPTATTDANGRVTFMGLAPGTWNVAATSGHQPFDLDGPNDWFGSPAGDIAYAQALHVPVQAGRVGEFTLRLVPPPAAVPLRVLGPDGKPMGGGTIKLQGLAYAPEPSLTFQSVTLDARGMGAFRPLMPGLWSLTVTFQDAVLNSPDNAAAPHLSGEVLAVASPGAPEPGPLLIRLTRHTLGSLRVRLAGIAGRPARGTVVVSNPFNDNLYAATVDARGEAVFAALPAGDYTVTAREPRLLPPPSLGEAGEPFPADSALRSVFAFPAQSVAVRDDAQTTAVFRPQRQGYVRGHLFVAGDRSRCYLSTNYDPSALAQVRLDLPTGEFVAGPFPPGPAPLTLGRLIAPPDLDAAHWIASPVAAAGAVLHVTLVPEGDRVVAAPNAAAPLLPMRAQETSDPLPPLAATVLMADGITPAWGARVAVLLPQGRVPRQMARADAAGHLTEGDYWRDTQQELRQAAGEPPPPPLGSPTAPVLVAWLPGTTGATIVPYVRGESACLVLPAPVSVPGRITVAGQAVPELNSVFHVIAAYEGRGKLNTLLSLDVPVQPDGTFVLAGLTPGTYRVQASRDNIWLSAPQAVTVGSAPLPPLALDIPLPGLPADLHIIDAAGQPLPGAVVTLPPPNGPLAEFIEPHALAADSAGFLHLPGLQAGPLRLSVRPSAAISAAAPGQAPPLAQFTLNIPPLAPGLPPLQKTLRCVPAVPGRAALPPAELHSAPTP